MRVCSRWCHVGETHPSLWVHLDFAPEIGHAKLLARAKAFAKRARPMSLDIHVEGTQHPIYDYFALVKFLESVAGRMNSLELAVTGDKIHEFYSLVLEKLLPKANPKSFTRFILHTQQQHYDIFITPPKCKMHLYGYRPDDFCFPVDISPEVLDRIFTPLKILDVCGIFPPWHSKAYHDLVELRLTSIDGLYSGITERELMNMLKASPRLRILHFALNIINQDIHLFPNGPVVLSDLEELGISASYNFQTEPTLEVGSLLRLITPGTKSLYLMLQTEDYGPGTSWEATKSFLSRANISKFHAKCGCLPINDLLRRMPHLTDLVFSSLEGGGSICGFNVKKLRRAIRDAPTVKSPLKSWTMRDCTIYLNQLKLMVDLYPTKSLILYNSNVWEDEEAEERISEAKLPSMFPTIKFIIDKPKTTCPNRPPNAESESDS
ncbi:hypothetical protein FRC11_005894 [Ceratobasidium sp. 423]|nr:hypothetical protein FRC11_005894 [Ceratobasidium sp. 423]